MDNNQVSDVYASTQNTASRNAKATSAILQVMNGADIGRIISLNKAVNELKVADAIPAIIAKRPTGYYFSRLMDNVDIKVDGVAIAAETKLDDDTKIHISGNNYTFFIE